ncbi:MAG: HupE/UreJ family protein [Rubrivivax sp.]|nr:MAG: HupE/UreJ family protein [Rubrivivax sp.]
MPKTAFFRTILACSQALATLAALTLASAAEAHVAESGLAHGHQAIGSFFTGFVHPLSGLDHLAAMVSVGLWSALQASDSNQRGHGRLWSAPFAFAATLLLGALMARQGVQMGGIEPMIATSVLVLGLLTATRQALPPAWGISLVASFALFHGLAHGQELGGGHAAAALMGMVLSTMALHAAGIAAGLALRRQNRWLPRLAGASVAGFGLSLLAPAAAALF